MCSFWCLSSLCGSVRCLVTAAGGLIRVHSCSSFALPLSSWRLHCVLSVRLSCLVSLSALLILVRPVWIFPAPTLNLPALYWILFTVVVRVYDLGWSSQLLSSLAWSMERMECQEDQMMATGHAVQALVTQVSELTTQLQQLKNETASFQHPPNPPAPVDQIVRSTELHLPPPVFYSGEPQLCRSFLAKCSLYISLQPSSFPTEESKVAFVITLLSGRAASWGTIVWEQRLPCCVSFRSFFEEIKKVFDRAASGREAARLLVELRQGYRTVTDYSIEFRTLAVECGWNSEAQWDMFLYGLSESIKDEIYSLELPTGVDKLIDLAIQLDTRLRQRGQRTPRRLSWILSLCKWAGPIFHSRRSRDAGTGVCVCIVELPATSLCSVQ